MLHADGTTERVVVGPESGGVVNASSFLFQVIHFTQRA
jgi:hypothetical protein